MVQFITYGTIERYIKILCCCMVRLDDLSEVHLEYL